MTKNRGRPTTQLKCHMPPRLGEDFTKWQKRYKLSDAETVRRLIFLYNTKRTVRKWVRELETESAYTSIFERKQRPHQEYDLVELPDGMYEWRPKVKEDLEANAEVPLVVGEDC